MMKKSTKSLILLCLLISGPRQAEGWSADSASVDFFDIKGDVETLLELGGCAEQFSFVAERHVALHPGQSAAIRKLLAAFASGGHVLLEDRPGSPQSKRPILVGAT